MAQPSANIPGSRPVETTPIRIGRSQPGTPQLQQGRFYPATVVRGGESPVLRLAGHNVAAEPRYPTLQEGSRLLVKPEIQSNRVVLQVVGHNDVLGRVANRYGQMLNRFPWPLPSGGQAAMGQGGASAGGQSGAAGARAAVATTGPGQGGLTMGVAGRVAASARMPTGMLLQAAGGVPGGGAPGTGGGEALPRLTTGPGSAAALQGRVAPGNPPRAPLLPQVQTTPAPSSALPTGSPAGQATAPPGAGASYAGASASAAGRGGPSFSNALLGGGRAATPGQPPQIGADTQQIRGWLERLLEPAGEERPDRADQRQALWDRLLTEKGRMLLDRWAFLPLPFRGEESGAWLQVQERTPEGDDEADPEPTALRIWLNADHLGAMEVVMPLQAGRTWRIRCERAEAQAQLEGARRELERLCRRAGHPVALRVEGPDPDLGQPPESLQEAAAIEHSVSSRA